MAEIPRTLRFSGLYYPQIKRDLLVWRRTNLRELNDEDPHEPTVQISDAYALGLHYLSVLLDHVAQEALLPTAKLRRTVKAMLSLIDYRLSEATPATVDVVCQLSSPFAVAFDFPIGLIFSAGRGAEQVTFESLLEITAEPSGNPEFAYSYDLSGDAYTDRTAESGGVGTYTPWGGVPAAGDVLYLGHGWVCPDGIRIALAAVGDIWGDGNHVWEYPDALQTQVAPTSATPGGSSIVFDITSLLGANNRAGAEVIVLCLATGESELVTTTWSGSANIATTGPLGQTVASSSASDYAVYAAWLEVPDLVEEVGADYVAISFTLPESQTRAWNRISINGSAGMWLRLRIVAASSTAPTFGEVEWDDGDQYVKFATVQGITYSDDPIGTSDGSADQEFTTSAANIIDGTVRVYVLEGTNLVQWEEVENFLASTSASRHYTLSYTNDSEAVIKFGDGVAGRIPTAGWEVRVDYRYGADLDGNVAVEAVDTYRTGRGAMRRVWNPRAATGWAAAEGSTEDSLEEAKVAGPASLRARGVAMTSDDIEAMAIAWTASDGASPVRRAFALPDAYGPKTVGLYVVGASGAFVEATYLDEIETYFNGDPISGDEGVLVVGHRVVALNYTPVSIDVTATINGGDVAAAEEAVAAFLAPLAKKSDGSWEHEALDVVYASRVYDVIFDSDVDIEDVVVTLPAANVALGVGQLPIAGTITISEA